MLSLMIVAARLREIRTLLFLLSQQALITHLFMAVDIYFHERIYCYSASFIQREMVHQEKINNFTFVANHLWK